MKKARFRHVKQGKVAPNQNKKEQSFSLASRKDYFKALLTDSFMLWMPVVYIVIYFVFGSREGFGAHKLLGWLYILIPLTIIEALFLYIASQTPGMKAYNLKLIWQKTRQKPPLSIIIARQILAKFCFFTFAWLFIFFNKNGKTLPDILLNTAFIYDEEK